MPRPEPATPQPSIEPTTSGQLIVPNPPTSPALPQTTNPSQPTFPAHLAKQNRVRIRRPGDVRESFLIDPSLPTPDGVGDKALDIETTSEKAAVDVTVYLLAERRNEAGGEEEPVEIAIKASKARLVIAHTSGSPRVKLRFQTLKRHTNVLEVHLCPNLRVDLDAKWSKDCILKLPPDFTGRLDLQSGKNQLITIESALKPRTRIMNEDRGSQLLWVGEYTSGRIEADYDRCVIRTEGKISLGVWERDPHVVVEATPDPMDRLEAYQVAKVAITKAFGPESSSSDFFKRMFGTKKRPAPSLI